MMKCELPEDINIPSMTASALTFPVSDDTSSINEMREIDKSELVEELLWLRKTSKADVEESMNEVKYLQLQLINSAREVEALQLQLTNSVREVEYLQRQCTTNVRVAEQLRMKLTNSYAAGIAGEEAWRLRCLAAEKIQAIPFDYGNLPEDSLLHDNYSLGNKNSIQQLPDKNVLLTIYDNMRLWSSGYLRSGDQIAKEKMQISSRNTPFTLCARSRLSERLSNEYHKLAEANIQQILDSPISKPSTDTSSRKNLHAGSIRNLDETSNTNKHEENTYFVPLGRQTDGERGTLNQILLRGNVKSQEDLLLIISSRDKIIISLEQTVNQQLDIIQDMRDEMVRLVEIKSINDKSITSPGKQK